MLTNISTSVKYTPYKSHQFTVLMQQRRDSTKEKSIVDLTLDALFFLSRPGSNPIEVLTQYPPLYEYRKPSFTSREKPTTRPCRTPTPVPPAIFVSLLFTTHNNVSKGKLIKDREMVQPRVCVVA